MSVRCFVLALELFFNNQQNLGFLKRRYPSRTNKILHPARPLSKRATKIEHFSICSISYTSYHFFWRYYSLNKHTFWWVYVSSWQEGIKLEEKNFFTVTKITNVDQTLLEGKLLYKYFISECQMWNEYKIWKEILVVVYTTAYFPQFTCIIYLSTILARCIHFIYSC